MQYNELLENNYVNSSKHTYIIGKFGMRLQKDFDPIVYAKHFNARVAHYLALKKFAFEKPLVDTNARFFQMDNCLFRS